MTNHLGERTYQTYNGWRRAVLANHPAAQFEGDKDIGYAFVYRGDGAIINGRKAVGEWDGDTGCLFSVCLAHMTVGAVLRHKQG